MTKSLPARKGLIQPFIVSRLFSKKSEGHIVFGIPYSVILSFRNSPPPLQVVGTLGMQLLLQFNSDSFETLHVLRSWSEDVHIVWI